jgi:hypothetical protein
MLDWPEDVCPGQVWFEYPATSVPFSKRCGGTRGLADNWGIGQPSARCGRSGQLLMPALVAAGPLP